MCNDRKIAEQKLIREKAISTNLWTPFFNKASKIKT